MSEPKKYVTFRDLKDLAKKEEAGSDTISSTSTSSISRTSSSTSAPSSTSIDTKKKTNSVKKQGPTAIAPERDFQRVPNSVTRQALQGGVFRGRSKQVWDYLWSISRGAIIPTRVVKRSRREIKIGSGLGSMVTVDAAIDHLTKVGLLSVKPAVGSLSGNEYEVFAPEEIALQKERYTSTSSIPSSASPTQKMDDLDIPEISISSTTQPPTDSTGYKASNTFLNTTDDDDTHTLLSYFSKTLLDAARELVGGNLLVTERERVLWNECACVLVEELKKAAEHTEAISSIPAFLTAHLRRRFVINQKPITKTKKHDQNSKTIAVQPTVNNQSTDAKLEGERGETKQGSKYSLEECRRYAEHLHKSGQGINNPGGYATTIYRTGEADTLIEGFLNPEAIGSGDKNKCPDCRGLGFVYPEGVEKGVVAKCKHQRLPLALKIEEQINELRRLHGTDSDYKMSDLIADLKYHCEREQIIWDEAIMSNLLLESDNNITVR